MRTAIGYITLVDINDGSPGAGFYAGTYSTLSTVTSTINSRFLAIAGRAAINGDIFTQSLINGTASLTLEYNGSSWNTPAFVIDGSIVATGSVAGDRLIAGTEITAPIVTGGLLRGARIELLGSSALIVNSGTPFGPNNLLEWKGPAILNGGQVDLSLLTKNNGSYWFDSLGNSYFGGDLRIGTIVETIRTTNLNSNQTITLGPFVSNGGAKEVNVRFTFGAASFPSGSCPSNPTQPSVNLLIERSTNGTSWTTMSNTSHTGSTTTQFEPEPPASCIINESLDVPISTTDTNLTTGNQYYRATISGQTRYHGIGDTDNNILSIEVIEE